ncbi:biotin--[bacterium]|nr:biotin--[acetyl-CoA-carboxylase] ligase [bacterium]
MKYCKLLFLEEIDSTNNYAKTHISDIDDKTVVYTNKQTNGRGRFDRKWIDLGNENLYLSIVLKPSENLKSTYCNMTQYASLKLSETFDEYGVESFIKWPNDILINNKKISGILAESVIKSGYMQGIVLGIGINLNSKTNDLAKINKAATSLNIEIQNKVDKNKFLDKFTEKFFRDYDKFLVNGFLYIKDDYIKKINFIGKEITITNMDNNITGIAECVTDTGAIIINNQEFYTGDITF